MRISGGRGLIVLVFAQDAAEATPCGGVALVGVRPLLRHFE